MGRLVVMYNTPPPFSTMWFGHLRSINRNVWITKWHGCTCMLHTTCRTEQNHFLFHTTQLNFVWPNHMFCSSHASRIFAGSPGEYCRMEIILLFPPNRMYSSSRVPAESLLVLQVNIVEWRLYCNIPNHNSDMCIVVLLITEKWHIFESQT